jgi:SAM-dependent methyltransferase
MSAPTLVADPSHAFSQEAHFGSGGSAPYDRALARGHGILHLFDVATGEHVTELDVSLFSGPAQSADLDMLQRATGSIIDIGCGPGRIVQAAIDRGLTALGIDTSFTAVSIAREAGLPVIRHSVFNPLPTAEHGQRGSASLVDGNIGIGGDPVTLLERCAGLIEPNGVVLVETHTDDARDLIFDAMLRDDQGNESQTFPWAEVGVDALHDYAGQAGLRIRDAWHAEGRRFARLTHSEVRAVA